MRAPLIACSIAVIIISSACIVVNSMRLAQAAGMMSPDPVLDAVAIAVLAAVLVVMTATLCGSGYTLTSKGVVRNIGVFFAFMPYKDIWLIRYDTAKTMMLIYYSVSKNGTLKDEMTGAQSKFERVVISGKHFDDFADAVRKHAPNVAVEVVDREQKND